MTNTRNAYRAALRDLSDYRLAREWEACVRSSATATDPKKARLYREATQDAREEMLKRQAVMS